MTPGGGTLTEGERALIRVASALAAAGPGADSPELEETLEAAARVAPASEVEEVLLQSYLFLGYPAALNAFALWRRVAGVEAPEATEDRWHAWVRRGGEVCRRVYGGQYGRLRDNVRRLHPDMERWMVAEGYGKVLGRAGLDLGRRELCIVAVLAVVSASTQLYSHLRGALNVGVDPERVEETLRVAAEFAEPEARSAARETWRRVRSRAGDGPGDAGSGV